MTLSLTPAAVCQCFTLVSLCTSIADPNWIEVRNTSDPSGRQLIYGVAFTLHAAQNLTDTGPLGGSNGLGLWLLYALAAVCYGTVLLSSSAFLLDFLGIGTAHPRPIGALHVCTAVLSVAILGVFSACMFVISRNLQKLGAPAKGSVSADKRILELHVGESLIIAILGIIFSCSAAAFSLCSQSDRGGTSSRDCAVIEEGADTEPLMGGAEREECVGEVSPD
ncbi:hypothetical protein AALO_G00166720 [Alosa alosa]|uniref:Uncharacterized protein n=1 Tax=Alosa alosa TaxID=278164 RepID=A0AAV6GG56_9TELE|nr:uncharacterized protein LOC121680741 [Alosa sapidissima]XP_048114079.1 uncharacterized protein LOC125304099 [Alosa alosa]KAG5272547.1 hypothetical protein AALO_G00166720 [Alosa alosa]